MAGTSDDIAPKAEGILSHMNNDHKDSLAYLATHYGDLAQPLKPNQVVMTAIDKKHLEIAYTTKKGAEPGKGKPGSRTVHVPFRPYLAGYSEVRTRLVDMSAVSEKVITTRKPDIIYRAPKFLINLQFVLIIAYFALRSDTLASHGITQSIVPSDRLAHWNDLRNVRLGGPAKMDKFMKSIARAHVVEGALMAALCWWKGATKLVAARWIATTTFLGIPSWIAFFALNSHKKALRRAIHIDADKKRK
ncbi:Protein of unknown function DUF4499 [Kalmanozyma brasiliensis GHG001]|uniref:DUF2470 domain-containing protein n=1 Tax=Kalmanozyma brasiliensis (strain GHG001) TaxID=1365824 RepID=V5ERG5_KALBG|nr:Protein of unknown function DUF4499 [Kalmanozyma brasiliensis GHG001]EST07725.1 Protein of unknown function DUF4499 [Kalmanozyma brasiliensis GHG001]